MQLLKKKKKKAQAIPKGKKTLFLPEQALDPDMAGVLGVGIIRPGTQKPLYYTKGHDRESRQHTRTGNANREMFILKKNQRRNARGVPTVAQL